MTNAAPKPALSINTLETTITTAIENILKSGTISTSGSGATVEVAKVIAALEMMAKFDAASALQALKNQDWMTDYKTVEEIASVIGIFVPVAAIIANDMKIAEPIVPAVIYVIEHSTPGTVENLVDPARYADPIE